MTGYKAMIHDRMPQEWYDGLIKCKALTRWIDYVYETHLRNINSHWNKSERNKLKNRTLKRLFKQPFHCSLDLLQMDKDWNEYWNIVIEYVEIEEKKSGRYEQNTTSMFPLVFSSVEDAILVN